MIILPTVNPNKLLEDLKSAIDRKYIRSWRYDADGDFTHTNDLWAGQAWLRPKVEEGKLSFFIVPPKDTHISSSVYAVYHGRFIEAVLRRFDTQISGTISASPLPMDDDEVQ